MSETQRFKGQRVIVTGGASGIGAQIAEDFLAEGAHVAILDRDADKLELMRSTHPDVVAVDTDLEDSTTGRMRLAEAIAALGGLHVLVNNAATCSDTPLERLGDDEWSRDLQVNLAAPFALAQAALPHLIETKGAILNMASVNGLTYFGNESYSASKAALMSLTKALAVRFGPHGIRANAIAPGTIRTPIWDHRLELDPSALDVATKWYPMGRLGTVKDVSHAALFLCSDDASWITGVTLAVDGGLTAGNAIMAREIVPEP